MEEIIEYFKANPVIYLATVDPDGKARNRPFAFALEYGGKLWFCTSNTKKVYQQMVMNPWVEFCTCAKDYSWVRLEGKVVFDDNKAVKEACLKCPMVKKNYHSADNPEFEVFYLSEARATIVDHTGNPPLVFSL